MSLISWLEGNMLPCAYKKYFGFDGFREFSKFKSETDLFSNVGSISQRDIGN